MEVAPATQPTASGEYAERKQPVIKGVLLSVADSQRDAGASVLASSQFSTAQLGGSVSSSVLHL